MLVRVHGWEISVSLYHFSIFYNVDVLNTKIKDLTLGSAFHTNITSEIMGNVYKFVKAYHY